jgi:hypothetical protein
MRIVELEDFRRENREVVNREAISTGHIANDKIVFKVIIDK